MVKEIGGPNALTFTLDIWAKLFIMTILHDCLLLQVVINPNYEVAESDYTNNVMKCRSRYDGHRIWTYNCHIGENITKNSYLHFSSVKVVRFVFIEHVLYYLIILILNPCSCRKTSEDKNLFTKYTVLILWHYIKNTYKDGQRSCLLCSNTWWKCI